MGKLINIRHRGWNLKEGDRVTFSVADSCGVCPECTLHKIRPQLSDERNSYWTVARKTLMRAGRSLPASQVASEMRVSYEVRILYTRTLPLPSCCVMFCWTKVWPRPNF